MLILRTAFWLLERAFAAQPLEKRTIVVNNQPVQFSPERFVRPLGWIIAILFGFFYGARDEGGVANVCALFQPGGRRRLPDPIFQKPLGFYLFSLPVYDLLSSLVDHARLRRSLRGDRLSPC